MNREEYFNYYKHPDFKDYPYPFPEDLNPEQRERKMEEDRKNRNQYDFGMFKNFYPKSAKKFNNFLTTVPRTNSEGKPFVKYNGMAEEIFHSMQTIPCVTYRRIPHPHPLCNFLHSTDLIYDKVWVNGIMLLSFSNMFTPDLSISIISIEPEMINLYYSFEEIQKLINRKKWWKETRLNGYNVFSTSSNFNLINADIPFEKWDDYYSELFEGLTEMLWVD